MWIPIIFHVHCNPLDTYLTIYNGWRYIYKKVYWPFWDNLLNQWIYLKLIIWLTCNGLCRLPQIWKHDDTQVTIICILLGVIQRGNQHQIRRKYKIEKIVQFFPFSRIHGRYIFSWRPVTSMSIMNETIHMDDSVLWEHIEAVGPL